MLKDKKHFNEIQLSAKEQLQSVSYPTKQEQHFLSHPSTEEYIDNIKKTILLVEDNKAIRAYIKESLQNTYMILESPDGLDGWEQATSSVPDLILSDVMMSG